jgi:3-oxoacyl-[acyl-carrier protein] reductase
MMLIDFTGRSVLVAGAARGIGRGIVEGFAASNARVFAADRLEAEMAGLPAECRCVDLLDKGAVRDWVDACDASAARAPDVLVYVAGGVLGQAPRPVEEVPEEDFRAVVDANLTGAFLAAQAVVPGMKSRGSGRIVFIASGAGLRTSLTGIQAYASAKAGEIGLARQLGQELGQFGITVNSVAPGLIPSNPASAAQWEGYGDEKQRAMIQAIPMRRLGTAQEIADAVVFFASPLANFVNGQIIHMSGGR